MFNEFEILKIKINNRIVGCSLEEIKRVITDVSDISVDIAGSVKEKIRVYKLGELLGFPEEAEYNSLLVVEQTPGTRLFISIPAVTDVQKLALSQVLVVPDYIRRKQNPFVVWGFVAEEESMITLITFTHFKGMENKEKEG